MRKQALIVLLVLLLSIAMASAASAAPGANGGRGVHRVGFGETLSSIAVQYGVTVEALMWQNGLANPNMIYVGQPLVIPGGYGDPGGYAAPPMTRGCGNSHTVSAGQTLSSIALNYGVSPHELAAMNNLYNQDMVYVGQSLCVPGGRGYAPSPVGYPAYAPPNAHRHIVVFGETLHGIAERYGVNYLDIMQANGLVDPSLIVINQQLVVPGYQPQAAPPPVYVSKPAYGPPPAPPIAPPPAPGYNDSYDHSVAPPPYKPPYKPPHAGNAVPPPAPEYNPNPVAARLPLADEPIEIVINGGFSWVGTSYGSWPDPNGITTLIVNTEEWTKSLDLLPTVWIRSGDYEVKGDLTNTLPEFGIDKFRFVFKYIPPGDYDVWLEDPEGTPSEKVPVEVNPGERLEVGFRYGLSFRGPTFASPSGWYIGDWDNPSKPGQNIGGWSNILVHTPASGLRVMIESEGGGYKATCFTGSKGPGACDFAGLMAGIYFIWIDGTDLKLKTYMDGNAYATFTFVNQPTPEYEDLIGPVDYPPPNEPPDDDDDWD